MSYTWDDDAPKPDLRVSLAGKVLAGTRILLFLLWMAIVYSLGVLVRLVEPLAFGAHRPVSHRMIQGFFAVSLAIFGIRVRTEGTPMRTAGVVVANHSSWLDIFAIYARHRVYFVAKDDVAGWPVVGRLVRFSGALFINRSRRGSAAQIVDLRDRVLAGHRLNFFPEGTSSDGQRVLPFKPTLFAAFVDPALRDITRVQPVTIVYTAPKGADRRFYAWWGQMTLGPHFIKVVSRLRQGSVKLIYHEPVAVADFADRKALAAHCEAVIRARFEAEQGG